MDKEQFELNLLTSQREEIVKDMKELTERAVKLLITFVPLGATLLFSYLTVAYEAYAPALRFAIVEMIILLSMVITGCLFAANVDRDYIAAIDEYIFEHNDVSDLFFAGELSKKHTTGIRGAFPLMMIVCGFSVACAVGVLSIEFFKFDRIFYQQNPHLVAIMVDQLIAFAAVLLVNAKRKVSLKSEVTNECLTYLNRKNTNKTNVG